MPPLNIKALGLFGVNVDKDPLELGDNELRRAQNAIHEPLGVNAGLVNRPGLIQYGDAVSVGPVPGSVLGGVSVPALDTHAGEARVRTIYIGRSPIT